VQCSCSLWHCQLLCFLLLLLLLLGLTDRGGLQLRLLPLSSGSSRCIPAAMPLLVPAVDAIIAVITAPALAAAAAVLVIAAAAFL
jgi:hypothetical protein